MCLWTLGDAHLDIDGVVVDVHLDGLDVGEHVTVVVVVVSGSVVVFAQALLDMSLVVDIAALHAEDGVQIVGGDNGITHPRDVADVVLVALIELDIDIDVLVVVR